MTHDKKIDAAVEKLKEAIRAEIEADALIDILAGDFYREDIAALLQRFDAHTGSEAHTNLMIAYLFHELVAQKRIVAEWFGLHDQSKDPRYIAAYDCEDNIVKFEIGPINVRFYARKTRMRRKK